MTTIEYRDNLLQQLNQTAAKLEQLRGAITACNDILAEEETTVPTEEEESDE